MVSYQKALRNHQIVPNTSEAERVLPRAVKWGCHQLGEIILNVSNEVSDTEHLKSGTQIRHFIL
jgi:hypothetical protein